MLSPARLFKRALTGYHIYFIMLFIPQLINSWEVLHVLDYVVSVTIVTDHKRMSTHFEYEGVPRDTL